MFYVCACMRIQAFYDYLTDMARAIAENFDYVFRNALYFVHQSMGFAQLRLLYRITIPWTVSSRHCTFQASTCFQARTSVDVYKIQGLHNLILRELNENKLENITIGKNS